MVKGLFFKIISLCLSLLIVGVISVGGILGYYSTKLPAVNGIADFNPPIPSQIISDDGVVLLETGTEKREIVKVEEIPSRIIDAFLAAEDSNFYKHNGVDYLGILRATIANIKAGRVVQGGSTITQQVAKQLYLTRERSIARKIKDMLLARKLEDRFTKDQILYLYLNQVYLGGGYYGVKAAFKGYFNKELEEATVAECALVAGLLVAPGKYSPYVNPIFAKKRQNYVLERLFMNGKISRESYESARNEVLRFRIRKSKALRGGHFTEWVRKRVVDKVGSDEFLQNGFKVVTTINWEMQKEAEIYVKEGVEEIDKRQGFKGAIGSLDLKDLKERIVEKRKKTYRDNSHYFLLAPNGDKKFELEFTEEEITNLHTYQESYERKLDGHKFYPDNIQEDPYHQFIREGDYYNGVVEFIDDKQRIIYIDIDGIKGFIPERYYRWARERIVSDERNYTPPVKFASKILKPGDIVRVKVRRKKRPAYFGFKTELKDKIKVQKELRSKYVSQKFYELSLEQRPDAEGALVALDIESGKIISMVGGADFSKSQFNRAVQSLRQPGSSFKPFLYAAALEEGMTPNSIIIDSPEALGGSNDNLNWKPRNYDGKFKGPITLRRSLELSRNIPTIKITQEIGVDKAISFVRRLGLDAKIDEDLSMSLGSFGVTLLNLTASYGVFPNAGKKVKPFSIVSVVDRFGEEYSIENQEEDNSTEVENDELNNVALAELEESEESPEEEINPYLTDLTENYVYDKKLAYIMSNLLKGVIQYGTGKGARAVSSFIGGKTGTTNNYVDALFLGFSPKISLGVWTGFDDNKTLGWGETGAKSALPIWKKYIALYKSKFGETDFRVPDGIVNVRIDKKTGELANSNTEASLMESFVQGTEPGAEPKVEVSEDTPVTTDIYNDDYLTSQ